MRSRPRHVLSVTFALLLLQGTVFAQERLVIWTDQPEMAFVSEVFNVTGDLQAEVRFKPNLAAAFAREEMDADLVVGEFINTPVVTARLLALDDLIAGLGERPLPALIESSRHGDTTRLVPLAYELPMILVNPRVNLRLRDTFISTEEILTNSRKFSRFDDDRPIRLGFIPGYDPLARYYLLRLRGVEFAASLEQQVRWDTAILDLESDWLDRWSAAIAGSRAAEAAFIERYLYDPPARQLERNRIAFAYSASSDQLDWQRRLDAGYRWLASQDNRVPILDTVVWAGIPVESRRERSAMAFLEWFFSPATQEDLILKKIEHRILRFGYFGGFSTLGSVNRDVLARVYPEIRGQIVPDILLDAPPQLPRYWNEAVEEVLVPLLNDQMIDASDLSSEVRAAMNTWYLQRGD